MTGGPGTTAPTGRPPPPEEMGRLLRRWTDGDEVARDRLMPLVYAALHGIVHTSLGHRRDGGPVRAGELVQRAYQGLGDRELRWSDRLSFFALCARPMRRIVVDYARAREKDGSRGGSEGLTLQTPSAGGTDGAAEDILALHEALKRIGHENGPAARAVEARLFAGLTGPEAAGAAGVTPDAVDRELRAVLAAVHTRHGPSEGAADP